ncbi:hypothetical protein [Fibrobacter sp.]|uniref:hypothetical protein n=1 Tax=Fibrobacter sp. TaxID=35828 RepID=UPI0038672B7E
MDSIRYFKLHNSAAFVVRIKVEVTDKDGKIYEVGKDGYDDICVGAERTFDLLNDPNRTITSGDTVRLKADVSGGTDKLAEESFTYDPNSPKTARYKITGSLFGKTLHFEDCN